MISNEGVTQPGAIETLEGEGMPVKGSGYKGNLYVKVNVYIPSFTDA